MALTKQELYAELRTPEAGMRPFTKVAGSDSINLAPSLTGQGGASFKRGGMEYAIASLDPIQARMDKEISKAYSKAQAILQLVRAAVFSFGDIREHWVQIDTEGGRIDRTLRLTDTKNGQKGALSIEYGRGEYEVETKSGKKYTIGGMTGKFILHRAFGVAPNSLNGTGGGDA